MYYYVDCENVGYRYEELLKRVHRYDRVVFCYTRSTPSITFEVLERLTVKNVKFEFLKCLAGSPSAADFQILMQVASNITAGLGTSHIVYSGDGDYELPAKAWRARGHDIEVVKCEMLPETPAPKKEAEQAFPVVNTISALQQDLLKLGVADVYARLLSQEVKRGMKPANLNALVGKYFNGERQSRVYHVCKGYI